VIQGKSQDTEDALKLINKLFNEIPSKSKKLAKEEWIREEEGRNKRRLNRARSTGG